MIMEKVRKEKSWWHFRWILWW